MENSSSSSSKPNRPHKLRCTTNRSLKNIIASPQKHRRNKGNNPNHPYNLQKKRRVEVLYKYLSSPPIFKKKPFDTSNSSCSSCSTSKPNKLRSTTNRSLKNITSHQKHRRNKLAWSSKEANTLMTLLSHSVRSMQSEGLPITTKTIDWESFQFKINRTVNSMKLIYQSIKEEHKLYQYQEMIFPEMIRLEKKLINKDQNIDWDWDGFANYIRANFLDDDASCSFIKGATENSKSCKDLSDSGNSNYLTITCDRIAVSLFSREKISQRLLFHMHKVFQSEIDATVFIGLDNEEMQLEWIKNKEKEIEEEEEEEE